MAKAKRFIPLVLRLLAFSATLSAAIVMVTSHEKTQVLNLTFTADYSDSPTFKYFVVAEAIASFYSVLALVFSFKNFNWRLILVLDVVITMVLTSSISAALAIAEVGKKGNRSAGWLPICRQVPEFCERVNGALIAAFAASLLYLLLLLHSFYFSLHHLSSF